MPKLLTKTNAYLSKTVRGYSLPLTVEEYEQLDQLCINYGKCRQMFFNQYCGINNLDKIRQYRKLRNEVRRSGYGKKLTKRYHFLGKFWVRSLQEACANIASMWSNLANRLRKVIQNNDELTEEERHWLCFVLKNETIWQAVLQCKVHFASDLSKGKQKAYLKVADQLSDEQLRHLSSYLRRITRRLKPKPRKAKLTNRSMSYEEDMYNIKDKRILEISSSVFGKRIKLKLTSDWHYKTTGNIQIIFDRDKKRVEAHKLIKTHTSTCYWGTVPTGADKGLYTPISSSSGKNTGEALVLYLISKLIY